MPHRNTHVDTTSLVIVESPAKAKTIQLYLGTEYKVIASGGHIMDLPSKSLSVDVQNQFRIQKVVIPLKSKKVSELKREIASYSRIYVATDPDREGEAIAFDIKGLGDGKKDWRRVAFREITQSHILSKMKEPDRFSPSTQEAQITRRIVDRLFGYLVSPVLWKKIQGNLSAGRVQSVLLRWICEREEEIRNFQSKEYFDLKVESAEGLTYQWVRGKDVYIPSEDFIKEWNDIPQLGQFPPIDKKGTSPIKKLFKVKSHKNEEVSYYGPPAFKTSSLQEVASKVLGFSPKKTMKIAQSLFEGVNLGSHRTGLITYPRTDSERINPEFEDSAKSYILETLGKDYVGTGKKESRSKKSIQDAHEAIRPTDIRISNELLGRFLSTDEFKLYSLIYKRTLASFTSPQRIQKESWEIVGMSELWNLNSEEEIFPGFMVWYEKKNLKKIDWKARVGDSVAISRINWEAKDTTPPSRYTHSTLVKKMESTGVGRPSTYSPSIEVLSERNYILWEKKHCSPTSLGEEVNRFLGASFSEFIRDDFTKLLEDNLDRIESGEVRSLEVLDPFYKKLTSSIHASPVAYKESRQCPECKQGVVQKKKEKSGKLIAYCSRFPECDYAEYV